VKLAEGRNEPLRAGWGIARAAASGAAGAGAYCPQAGAAGGMVFGQPHQELLLLQNRGFSDDPGLGQ
jgi:hypothetical protein